MRRPPGAGTIESYFGRFRARLPDARRTTLDVFDTEEEAAAALDAHLALSSAPRGETLRTYGGRWLEQRDRAGYRGIDQDRRRWSSNVVSWECIDWPLREIRRGDVRRWVDGLATNHEDQTVRNALNLVRVCLRAALDDGFIQANPAEGVRVHPRGHTRDVWTYLDPTEQAALLAAPVRSEYMRLLIRFAIGTGLRWSEQRQLRLEDVHLDGDNPHIYVRRSRRGAPKSTHHRTVPLFGTGFEATRSLVDVAVTRRNPLGLLCIGRKGQHLGCDRNGPRLGSWLEAAGITRHVRWHDLRHTCGSSLVAGWWGRAWTLLEVRDFLGHRTITTTERYAHLAGSVVEQAARETAAAGALGAQTTPKPTERSASTPAKKPNDSDAEEKGFEPLVACATAVFKTALGIAESLGNQVGLGADWAATPDPVENALRTALEAATAAEQWADVAALARELEARRAALADPRVVPLPRRRVD